MNSLVRRHATFSLVSSRISARMLSTTDFGFKTVDYSDKEKLVRGVFSSVATKYDIMNDFMSVGIHRLWKDDLIDMISFPAAAKADSTFVPRHLDVAGGTGDIAFRSIKEIVRSYGSSIERKTSIVPDAERQVVVCDINPEMLEVGKSRASAIGGPEDNQLVSFYLFFFPLYFAL